MPKAYVIFEQNDTLLEVKNLQDSSDDTYLNAATVTAVVKDENGVNVTGQVMPITLSYVASSDGIYQGILDSVLDLSDGDCGEVEVTAVEGTLDAFWTLPYRVKSRAS
jgi:hypothetical protein